MGSLSRLLIAAWFAAAFLGITAPALADGDSASWNQIPFLDKNHTESREGLDISLAQPASVTPFNLVYKIFVQNIGAPIDPATLAAPCQVTTPDGFECDEQSPYPSSQFVGFDVVGAVPAGMFAGSCVAVDALMTPDGTLSSGTVINKCIPLTTSGSFPSNPANPPIPRPPVGGGGGGLSSTPSPTGASHGRRCVVPKLNGKSLSAAGTLLRHAHCTLGKVKRLKGGPLHGHFVVVAQSPAAGARLPAGARVALRLKKR